jgi:hypothetical protein
MVEVFRSLVRANSGRYRQERLKVSGYCIAETSPTVCVTWRTSRASALKGGGALSRLPFDSDSEWRLSEPTPKPRNHGAAAVERRDLDGERMADQL